MDKERLAWLWLVRTYQPVSVNELIDKVVAGQVQLPMPLEGNLFDWEHPPYLERWTEDNVPWMIDSGLLTTEPSQPYSPDAKLKRSRTLERIQDAFSISLTELLKRSDTAIMVDPHYGKPTPAGQGSEWARIFVAMPFAEALKPIYTDHILKVTTALNLSCKRGDDFFTTNHIMHDVWSAIYHAELCIVDCTGRNPNVFYELGIAHTLGRKTVLITQKMDDIPFDVRSYRVIEYEYTPRGMQDFEDKLTKTLQTELRLEA